MSFPMKLHITTIDRGRIYWSKYLVNHKNKEELNCLNKMKGFLFGMRFVTASFLVVIWLNRLVAFEMMSFRTYCCFLSPQTTSLLHQIGSKTISRRNETLFSEQRIHIFINIKR